MLNWNWLRTAVAGFRGGRPAPSKADVRRSLAHSMAMGGAAAVAMVVGNEFVDSTGAMYLTGVAVALVILVLLGLLVGRLVPCPPSIRRMTWIVMLAFVVTMGIDNSFAAFPEKLVAVVGASLAFSLLANRVLDGSWFPRAKHERDKC